MELVGTKGEQLDTMEGNVINPGHAIELGWFLLDYLDVTGMQDVLLRDFAVNVCIKGSFDIGWDKVFAILLINILKNFEQKIQRKIMIKAYHGFGNLFGFYLFILASRLISRSNNQINIDTNQLRSDPSRGSLAMIRSIQLIICHDQT